MKMKTKKIIAALLILIFLSGLWSIAIGPRRLDVDTAEVYEQRIYYKFHTYKCVGWTMGGKNRLNQADALSMVCLLVITTAKAVTETDIL